MPRTLQFKRYPHATVAETIGANGELIIDEVMYHKGYTNQDISLFMTSCGVNKSVSIVADSAEPKSIEELRRMGWRIEGANKGKDSILNGIDILKRFRIKALLVENYSDITEILKEIENRFRKTKKRDAAPYLLQTGKN